MLVLGPLRWISLVEGLSRGRGLKRTGRRHRLVVVVGEMRMSLLET